MEERIMAWIEQECGVQVPSGAARLDTDLGLDSLGLVTLLVTLEDKFQITFKEEDMDPLSLQTVSDLVAIVTKYY